MYDIARQINAFSPPFMFYDGDDNDDTKQDDTLQPGDVDPGAEYADPKIGEGYKKDNNVL